MSFFTELKRRNVFRVGIAYLIVAWLVMQVSDVIINNIGAPDWVFQVILLVLGIGFPVVLVFAWAYEMTPEGLKREKDVDRSQSITAQTGNKLNHSIIVVLALALAYFAWDKFSRPDAAKTPDTTPTTGQATIEKSIAVLPFVNMSADKENEYFSDGLSEELLNLLAKVDGLKVAARTSSFKFKDSDADIGEIGHQLKVATVLEGSVRKSGNQARITAQLIKVDDGFHLWSETYDRNLDNIFEVQDEIAGAIVDALKLPLLGHDAKPLATATAGSFAAYDLYLQGRHYARQYSESGFMKAIDYYRSALELDPSFTQALAGLADSYVFLADFGNLPQGEAQQLAREAVDTALSLDPDSPEAHAAMGVLLHNMGQYQAAGNHFEHALKVNPNQVNALIWYRQTLSTLGRNTQAYELATKAMNLDPLSMPVRRHYTFQLIAMHEDDAAMGEIQAMIAANPDDATAYEIWGDLFRMRGLPHKAIPMYRNAHRLRPGDIYMAARNVEAALQLGDDSLVDHWLSEARQRGSDAQWTRTAEIWAMYAGGDFAALLNQVDQLLALQPGQRGLLGYRYLALWNLGQMDPAREALLQAMGPEGYQYGQSISRDQLSLVVQVAHVLDQAGDTSERDRLLSDISGIMEHLMRDEPPNEGLAFINAQVATVRGDLQATLRHLESAVSLGFVSHWELIRDPVFSRWQDNEEFKAFYQGMLKTAAGMLREYKANNPEDNSTPAGRMFG